MVDTCRLKKEITYKEYIRFKSSIEKITGKKMNYYKKYDYYFTKHFKDMGFKRIILKNQKHDEIYYYHAVEIELHPVLLIRSDDYISLLQYKEVESFICRFNEEIKKIDEELPMFDGWDLDRVDYAVQFYSEFAPLYIKLFRRGDRSDYLKPCYDEKQHRRRQRDGSLYLKAEDYITINFYCKYDQLSKKHPEYEHLELAQNLLRMEVQCYKRKVQKMRSEDFSQLALLRGFFEPQICKKVILFYYQQIIGEGAYVTLKEAKNFIDQSKLNSKEKLKEVLELINTKKSIYNARKHFNEKYDKPDNKKFNRYLERLRTAGLNPVTIPVRKKVESFNILLQNPIKEIIKQLGTEVSTIDVDEFTELIV